MVLPPEEIATRLLAAMICGLFIGLDREIKHKNVGLRTFLLVCLGSAGFTMMVIEIVDHYNRTYEIGSDPTRIIQGIVTGIGFLGGGAILHSKGQVSGAATGASIWVCGAIGVACGYGFYWHAGILSAYVFIVLAVIGYLRAHCRSDMEDDSGSSVNNQNAND